MSSFDITGYRAAAGVADEERDPSPAAQHRGRDQSHEQAARDGLETSKMAQERILEGDLPDASPPAPRRTKLVADFRRDIMR
jgi:hypothetical protein